MALRVTEAHTYLCSCAGEAAVLRVPVLKLIEPPPHIVAKLNFHGRRHRAALQWRDFFTQSPHRAAAIVLGHAQNVVLTHVCDTEAQCVEYGIGKLGPFRFTSFKKRRFLRKQAPVLEWMSPEELCLGTDNPHDIIVATFRLLDATIDSLMSKKMR